MTDPSGLLSLHNPQFSPIDPWALVTENPPGPHIMEPVMALVGSGGGVHVGVSLPNTREQPLCVHIIELLTDIQRGALP